MEEFLKFNVNFYEEPPKGLEQLHKAIDKAWNRLRLYQIFKSHEVITVDALKTKLGNNILKNLLETEKSVDVKQSRLVDYLGHWILKIAYCNNNTDFFVKCEVRWFKMRYNNMPEEDRERFLRMNNFVLQEPSEAEKLKFNLKGTNYKIHFTEVTNLVRQRLYPMWKGYVFVPKHKLVYWLSEKLEKKLLSVMPNYKKMLPSICPQFKTILDALELVTPYDYGLSKKLNLSDLENSIKHFPLCMRYQHEHLCKEYHLKHFSRLQYGLFLKGIGLSLDDSITLWKEKFMHKMTEERFNKQYLYFFKHIYGTVGSKRQYNPHSCDRILEQPVGPDQIHGCPFKEIDSSILVRRLEAEGLADVCVREIETHKNQEEFKTACTCYFKAVHGCNVNEIINHPNKYFEMSCNGGEVLDIEDLATN